MSTLGLATRRAIQRNPIYVLSFLPPSTAIARADNLLNTVGESNSPLSWHNAAAGRDEERHEAQSELLRVLFEPVGLKEREARERGRAQGNNDHDSDPMASRQCDRCNRHIFLRGWQSHQDYHVRQDRRTAYENVVRSSELDKEGIVVSGGQDGVDFGIIDPGTEAAVEVNITIQNSTQDPILCAAEGQVEGGQAWQHWHEDARHSFTPGYAGQFEDTLELVFWHCDFDCFFVSAGLVSRPELKGKPVVVCHSQGGQGGASSTSEIASASYEARAFGIKNGMSLQQGRALCPELVTIPYEFERYKQFSLQFYTVLMSHADDLQAVSVDEALIDVTETVSQLRQQAAAEGSQYDPAKDYAETIRAEVRKVTSCEVSIGIAHNILLARLATRKAKPGGSYHLLPEDVPEYLAPLELSDLHGFGRQTKAKAIDKFGTAKLGELAKKSKSQLIDAFGKATGEKLYNGLRGIATRNWSLINRGSLFPYGIRFENSEQAEQFIYQMAVEVKKRLDAIDMVGRSITMKIMKRDPTAPVEPAKFLGHGPCDLFSKQGPLIGPGGKATSDDQVIGEFAWRLLQSFNFDPKELRGIGMQITKLESANAAASAPAGQALLPFKRVESGNSAKATGSAGPSSARNSKTPAVIAPALPQASPKTEVKEDGGFDLPSFSQVDMTVFEALPPSLQKELKDEYSRRRSEAPAAPVAQAGPSRAARPAAIASPTKLGLGRRSGPPPGLFPSKAATKVNVKRITHQLAPHSHSNISPQKSALFALLQKKQPKQKTARVTVAKLKDLGIDPEVFAMLPKQIQDEQLVRARLLKERGSIPEVSEERKILKPKKPTLPPGFVVYRAPPPQARYKKRPVLRQQGKTKKEKLAFTEAEDVMDVMEKWVTTYQHWAPREKDVEYLSKFILQNADADNAGDWGVETAVKVMKWWLVLLRRFWAGSEFVDDEQWEDWSDSQEDPVGKAWWETFRKVKAQMDVVARKRFGGCISLK
ncbi:hypothetical protein NMY22_g6307 [Coprinellus aureogranulatus]|nr:hypothetical protein NMY22_g6307 [Coprinellus aureogranulatus]